MVNDHTLGLALEAFCRRAIEGNEANPTGIAWDEQDRAWQNAVKDKFVGPLHAAAKVLTAPRTVTTAEELEELPWGTVILVNPKNGSYPYACEKFVGKWYPVGTSIYHTSDSLLVDGKEFTVLHIGSQP